MKVSDEQGRNFRQPEVRGPLAAAHFVAGIRTILPSEERGIAAAGRPARRCFAARGPRSLLQRATSTTKCAVRGSARPPEDPHRDRRDRRCLSAPAPRRSTHPTSTSGAYLPAATRHWAGRRELMEDGFVERHRHGERGRTPTCSCICGDFFDNDRVEERVVHFAGEQIARFRRPSCTSCPATTTRWIRAASTGATTSRRWRPASGSSVNTAGEVIQSKNSTSSSGAAATSKATGTSVRSKASLRGSTVAGTSRMAMATSSAQTATTGARCSCTNIELSPSADDWDYLALGHWEPHADVSAGGLTAVYSGAPLALTDANQKAGWAIVIDFDGGRRPLAHRTRGSPRETLGRAMIPRRIKLENFLSYRQCELDFSGLKLAVLSGRNGDGKSALLDAMTWAVWGKGRGRTEDDRIRSRRRRHLGRVRVRVPRPHYRVIRKRTRGETPASLDFFQLQGRGWVAVTGGVQRETQAEIIRRLHMDFETFKNSAFIAQGRANEFTKRTPRERKDVFRKILGPRRLRRASIAANDRRKEVEGESRSLLARIEEARPTWKNSRPVEEAMARSAREIEVAETSRWRRSNRQSATFAN